MLYLAEVQKQKSGGILGGSSKTELKLLACQRTDQSWSAVTGDEAIAGDPDATNFNAGALVIVNLGNNRQIQGTCESAGRQLVGLLQNFSRLLEKSKNQEEEIEQWKQSLTYQSQELNRREMEMEARLEQLQQLEEDFERLEQQTREIEGAKEEAERLKEEFERNRAELEGAWEHLLGEQRRLEEQQADSQGAVLDAAQANQIQDLLNRLSGAVPPTDSVREELNQALAVADTQQDLLTQHWQQLEQQRHEAEQRQGEVDRQGADLKSRKQELQQAQTSLEQAKIQLKVQQTALEIKRESAQMLSLQLRTQEELYQQLTRLATTSANVKISQQVDLEALEKMPLGELEELIKNRQQDLEKRVRFVNDQEEELTFQRQEVEALQQKIEQASEYDRMSLETDLAEEQDRYQMLDQTLVGQRRNLRELEEIINQHSRVLRRRQGVADDSNADTLKIDLGPVLSQLEGQRQQQEGDLQKLEKQIEQMQSSIQQAEGMIAQQMGEQQGRDAELQNLEQNWQIQRVVVAEFWAKVTLYQEMLQPLQEGFNEFKQKLEGIASVLNQIQETGDYQLQAIAEMRQTLGSLIDVPQTA